MNEVFLLKLGEIVLKGLNRAQFESRLFKSVDRSLKNCGNYKRRCAQSTIYIEPSDEFFDCDGAQKNLSCVFGIIAVCRARVCAKSMADICETAASYCAAPLLRAHTFKVEAKRSDKRFPLNSMQIMEETGAYLLDKFPHLRVDVHNPEVTVHVEIRDFAAYVHSGPTAGAGGLPAGTGGRAAIMLSGGLDSPVAGYMMAKRGVELTAVHFTSPPYTSARSVDKVRELARILSVFCGTIKLYTIEITKIQEALRDFAPIDMFTILTRRYMARLTILAARDSECASVITGESLGQVASQTMSSIAVTDEIFDLPVFRPLIGMDKNEIIAITHKIGTYETSIAPYDDCCTVFTPKHPKLKPSLAEAAAAEAALDTQKLVKEAFAGAQIEIIKG